MADQVGDGPIDSSELTSRLGIELPEHPASWHSLTDPLPYEHGGLPTNERPEFLGT